MKGVSLIILLFICSVAYAQQPGIKSFSHDTTNIFSYRYLSLGDSTFLKLKQPEIQLDKNFYSLLQAPNTRGRYTSDLMPIKRPDFIPEMPVAPLDPFNKYYLLDLDPRVIPSRDE